MSIYESRKLLKLEAIIITIYQVENQRHVHDSE